MTNITTGVFSYGFVKISGLSFGVHAVHLRRQILGDETISVSTTRPHLSGEQSILPVLPIDGTAQDGGEVSSRIFVDLAEATKAVGTPKFYEMAASCVASMLDSNRYLVIRYGKYSKPEFLVNTAMQPDAVDDYLASFYRIDPLLRMVRTNVTQQLMTFDQLKRSGADTLFYDDLYRSAKILDELVLLLPTVGGVWTAICVDRSNTLFSQTEIERARQIFPVIEELHALHVDRCVFGWNGGYLDDSQIAFMMVDSENNPAFRNVLWQTKVTSDRETKIRDLSAERIEGIEALDDGLVVHWETLDLQNVVAPGGKAYLLEEPSPGYVDLAAKDLVEQFAGRYRLTPRETEIVEYILQGHPPSLIATTIGVSVGTIRNHKHRLYYKLDITTERELFCMFFDLIMGRM